MKNDKILIIIWLLCAATIFFYVDCSKPIKEEIVAQVDDDKISSDFIRLIIQDSLSAEKDIRKVLDTVIKDILLSTEAKKLGINESPLVKQKIGQELDHVYISWIMKSKNPKMSLKEILRNFNELTEELFDFIIENTKIKYEKINYTEAIIETRENKEKRKEIVIATINGENVTLQDILDRFPSYKEQRFFEGDEEYRESIVLQAIQMKYIKKKFNEVREENPILKEYLLRVEQRVLADIVCGIYNDPKAIYFKNETSDELFKIKLPKAKEEDLKLYYDHNPEKFKIADWIKIRHIAVENIENLKELLSQFSDGKVKSDEDFINLVRRYSISMDKKKDGDLGIIYNPIHHPGAEIPSLIPWPLARTKLFQLEKGEFSPYFRNEEGFHILFVYDRKDEIVPFSNDWARQTSLKYFKRTQKSDKLFDLIKKLQDESTIIINEEVLKDIERKL